MNVLTPRIKLDGEDVDFIKGNYKLGGELRAATFTFTLPSLKYSKRKFWNKEVSLYLNNKDTVPIFRGWVKRMKPSFNLLEIHAEDALGYFKKGGDLEETHVTLTKTDNIDGLTGGAAIKNIIERIKLDGKLKTDMIGDTSPPFTNTTEPYRGTTPAINIIKDILSKALNTTNQDLPRRNIGKLINDGSNTQFVIELESDLDNDSIVHTFSEHNNIQKISIVNRRVPTRIVVKGKDVEGTFTHDSARSAYDNNPLNVDNDTLLSPAACVEFGARLFQANLRNQYEYKLTVLDGAYLQENELVRVNVADKEYSGNYRVIGKQIDFNPSGFKIGVSLNRKPPTLAQYILSKDN